MILHFQPKHYPPRDGFFAKKTKKTEKNEIPRNIFKGLSGNRAPVSPLRTQKTHRHTLNFKHEKHEKNEPHEIFLNFKISFVPFRVFRKIRVRARLLFFSSFLFFSFQCVSAVFLWPQW